MIINDGSYVSTVTPTVTPTVSAPVLSAGAGAKVKKNLATSTDVAGIAAALTGMVDAIVSGAPSVMRVNGNVAPPRQRWKR